MFQIKQVLLNLQKNLVELGFEIISTGGTKKALEENGIPVIGVSEVTGFPEILDGRVKTLNPHIHGGLLAKFDDASHLEQMNEHSIRSDSNLVCVNLYPFQQTIEKPDVTLRMRLKILISVDHRCFVQLRKTMNM